MNNGLSAEQVKALVLHYEESRDVAHCNFENNQGTSWASYQRGRSEAYKNALGSLSDLGVDVDAIIEGAK
jgi:hypothetical protein